MTTPDDRDDRAGRPDSPLPTAVSAALGLAEAYVRGVRRLPVTAVKVPVHVVGYALVVTDNLRREYDELSQRGEALLSRLRGRGREEAAELAAETRGAAAAARAGAGVALQGAAGRADEAADRVEDAASRVAGRAAGAVDTGGRAAAGAVREGGHAAAGAVREAGAATGGAARETAGAVREAGDAVAAAAPAGAPQAATPAAPAAPPKPQRHHSAATGDVREEVESVTQALGGGAVPDAADLPLPGFDHMTLAQVRGRLRRLDVADLVVLRDYERAHADRLPIVTMLDNRISKLADDDTPGGSSAVSPGGSSGRAAAGGGGEPGGATGWPGDGGAGGGSGQGTGWPATTGGPASAGGDGVATGGPAVAATSDAAPDTPAGADAAGDDDRPGSAG